MENSTPQERHIGKKALQANAELRRSDMLLFVLKRLMSYENAKNRLLTKTLFFLMP